jgi:hypothetical protein
MNTLFGKPIVVNDVVTKIPKFTLSEFVTVSEDFRCDFNLWLLRTFGATDQVLMVRGMLIVSSDTLREIKRIGSIR